MALDYVLMGDRAIPILKEGDSMKYRYSLGGRVYETGQTATAIVLMIPTLAALAFLFIYPAVKVFFLSFTSTNTIMNVSTWIGLRNYGFILTNDIFQKAVMNTLKFTAVKIVLEVVISLFLAVMLDENIPMRKYLRICYFAPVIVPVVASSIIFMWLYDPQLGPLNQFLRFLHLPVSNYIYSEESALMSIIVFAVWRGIGYDIIIFISGLQGISDNVVDAARIDGASNLQILAKVKLPLLRPVIAFVVMMGLIGCFQAFTEVDIMTGGGPNNSTVLMVNYIYGQAFGNAKLGRGAAASMVLFSIIFFVTLAQKIWNDRQETYDE